MKCHPQFTRTRLQFCLIVVATCFGSFCLSVHRVGASELNETVLIDLADPWHYWDREQAPPDTWFQPDFDDAAWPSGSGLLGYDTRGRSQRWPKPGLQTELSPNRLTYLFRSSFDYQGDLNGIQLAIDHVIDDAAVIYLNGIEIARSAQLPKGELAFGTRATAVVGTPTLVETGWLIENPPLKSGKNVIAVSLHNERESSSDACLGLRLRVSPLPVEPLAIYLTWQNDPTCTMTVQWHTSTAEKAGGVQYRVRAEQESPITDALAQTHQMVFAERMIHTVELSGLQPDTEYEFRVINPDDQAFSRWYWFRTIPNTNDNPQRPLRLVLGGDLMHRTEWLAAANRQAMKLNPDAIIWGGDLAYANGLERNLSRWEQFFDTCHQTLVGDDGRLVPIIVGLGNHEVQGGYYWGNERGIEGYQNSDDFRSSIAPYFYNLFAFPGQPGYGVIDFGDYLSILILDTDHTNPVEGQQTQWLKQQLADRQHVRHVIPVYHVPAFPSVRNYNGSTSQRIREHWVPLFENSQVRVCFENHDHAYKRTVPIANLKQDDHGITYLGDGAWGVGLREQHKLADTWYLAQAEMEHHVLLATIVGDLLMVQVFTSDGRLIDQVQLPPRN